MLQWLLPENDSRYGTLLQAGDSALYKESHMVTYLIFYDLNKPSQNNEQLTGALRSKDARHILHSSWSLTTTLLGGAGAKLGHAVAR